MRRRLISFTGALFAGLSVFAVVMIPLFGILTEDGAETSSSAVPAAEAVQREILVFLENGEDSVCCSALTDLRSRSCAVTPIGRGGELASAYGYGGASYLRELIEREYPFEFDGYVILDKDGLEKIIDFIGGVIVKNTSLYYNNHQESLGGTRLIGSTFFDGLASLGIREVLEAAVSCFLEFGDTDGAMCCLFENSDTDLSYPSYLKIRGLFYGEGR